MYALMLCLMFVQEPQKDTFLSKHEQAAKDFSFENLKLNATLKDFKKIYPKARLLEEVPGDPVGTVNMRRDSSVASFAAYSFFDENLMLITIGYTTVDLNKAGGFAAILNKLENKYGKPERGKGIFNKEQDGRAAFIWQFPVVNRYIELSAVNDGAFVVAIDSSLYEAFRKRRNGP